MVVWRAWKNGEWDEGGHDGATLANRVAFLNAGHHRTVVGGLDWVTRSKTYLTLTDHSQRPHPPARASTPRAYTLHTAPASTNRWRYTVLARGYNGRVTSLNLTCHDTATAPESCLTRRGRFEPILAQLRAASDRASDT